MTWVRRKEISNVPERSLDLSWIGEAARSRSGDYRSSSEIFEFHRVDVSFACFCSKSSTSTSIRRTISGAGAKQAVTCVDNQEEGLMLKFHAEPATNSNVDAVQQISERGSIQTSSSHMLCMTRDAAREQAARSER
jgi:hypothetical protein